MSEKLTLAGLESFLDDTCDSLRKDRDAAELKEYVIAAKAFAEIEVMNRGCLGLLSTVDFNKTSENGDNLG